MKKNKQKLNRYNCINSSIVTTETFNYLLTFLYVPPKLKTTLQFYTSTHFCYFKMLIFFSLLLGFYYSVVTKQIISNKYYIITFCIPYNIYSYFYIIIITVYYFVDTKYKYRY